jgi:hypothetical protein
MSSNRPATGLAALPARRARIVAVLYCALALFCVGITLSPLKSDHRYNDLPGEGDLALYQAEAKRMQAGESYYDAVAAELRSRGYPMQSPFNWRMPLPLWLFGTLPADSARLLLAVASLVVLFMSLAVMEREFGAQATILGIPLLVGTLSACWLAPLFYLTELWAGVFIALSLCCFATNRRWCGVAAGLAAQFLRELSLVYSLVALGCALWRRQYREAAVWVAGLVIYALYLGYHVRAVAALTRPEDLYQLEGWIQLGGAAFIIGTAQLNSIIILLPQWVAALYFCAAMIGCAGWNTRTGQRFGLTITAYVITFSIVGHYYNQYWGAMYAPLLCFGVAGAPAAIRDLCIAAGWTSRQPRKSLTTP